MLYKRILKTVREKNDEGTEEDFHARKIILRNIGEACATGRVILAPNPRSIEKNFVGSANWVKHQFDVTNFTLFEALKEVSNDHPCLNKLLCESSTVGGGVAAGEGLVLFSAKWPVEKNSSDEPNQKVCKSPVSEADDEEASLLAVGGGRGHFEVDKVGRAAMSFVFSLDTEAGSLPAEDTTKDTSSGEMKEVLSQENKLPGNESDWPTLSPETLGNFSSDSPPPSNVGGESSKHITFLERKESPEEPDGEMDDLYGQHRRLIDEFCDRYVLHVEYSSLEFRNGIVESTWRTADLPLNSDNIAGAPFTGGRPVKVAKKDEITILSPSPATVNGKATLFCRSGSLCPSSLC